MSAATLSPSRGAGPQVAAPPTPARRPVVVCGVLAALSLVVAVLSLGTGEYPLTPGEVVRTLLGDGTTASSFIVETLRMPRVVCALLVGGALGAAGAVFQTLTRNPLGSPDVIGFTWGAATGAVLEIWLVGGSSLMLSGSAVVGGLVTALVVYGLALGSGPVGARLILIGIGTSALLAAITTFILARADLGVAQGARIWLAGSLNGRGWEFAWPLAGALVVLVPLLVLLARPLRMLELGDDAASGIGVDVARMRPRLILVGVALSGVATAAAGPVPFVALAAPQLARRLTRAAGPGLIAAALMGALLLAASDLAVQRLLPTGGLPVGTMTGALGGAYLIWLLNREWRKR